MYSFALPCEQFAPENPSSKILKEFQILKRVLIILYFQEEIVKFEFLFLAQTG